MTQVSNLIEKLANMIAEVDAKFDMRMELRKQEITQLRDWVNDLEDRIMRLENE